MDRKEQVKTLLETLNRAEKEIGKEAAKQVMIENAINLRLMCDYVVSCSYGDIVLIICMIHDYIKMLDEIKTNDIEYQAYYRKVFLRMAERLAGQIHYDYDAAVEKCKKKLEKAESSDDVGEEAMALTVKRSVQDFKRKEEMRREKMKEKDKLKNGKNGR